ncbi:AAA domain-containing protein [Xylariaceae sp. FL0016]|nr:AAA domain-containing protein [Xylariaceae sp. FL0016]
MEAILVRQHVRKLVEAGIKPEDIAVVTPYNAQLGLLAPLKEKFAGIELGSVDGFQGREKEAVIVSMVRSNSDGEVGFLSEKRRLNGGASFSITGWSGSRTMPIFVTPTWPLSKSDDGRLSR